MKHISGLVGTDAHLMQLQLNVYVSFNKNINIFVVMNVLMILDYYFVFYFKTKKGNPKIKNLFNAGNML